MEVEVDVGGLGVMAMLLVSVVILLISILGSFTVTMRFTMSASVNVARVTTMLTL